MATYTVDVRWTLKDGDDVLKGRFSRAHDVSFDGGITVPASASPHVVGKWAVEAAVDPEEMLVAALSSCHMLSFLHVARLAGFAAAAYSDHARRRDGGDCAGEASDHKGRVAPADRVDGRRSGQGETGASAPPGARYLLHRQFGDDASHGGIAFLAAPLTRPSERARRGSQPDRPPCRRSAPSARLRGRARRLRAPAGRRGRSRRGR